MSEAIFSSSFNSNHRASYLAAFGNDIILSGYTDGSDDNYGQELWMIDVTAPNAPTSLTTTSALTNDTTPEITGTAEANSRVNLYNGTSASAIGTALADDDGAFSITLYQTFYEGSYELTATATDWGNNTSSHSDSLSLTIETTAPTLSSSSPTDDATYVSVVSDIVLNFSEAVYVNTAGEILIKKASDDETYETINIDDYVSGSGTSEITISPGSVFQELASYYIQISSDTFEDAAGNYYEGINDKTSLSFTATELTDPFATGFSPADDSTSVSTESDLVLTFSEAVYAQTGNFVIYKAEDDEIFETINVKGSRVSGDGTNEITIDPSDDFNENTSYYVFIDSTAFDDIAGNSLTGVSDATSYNFTTAYVDDGEAEFSISGTVGFGETLAISEDTADADGTGTLSYSWQTSSDDSDWDVVGTDSSYTIAASDEGKSIKAVISYEDGQGFDETVTTDSSSISITDDGIAEFSIRGTKRISNLLTISEDESDPDGTGSLSYRWQSSSNGRNSWKNMSTKSYYHIKYRDTGKYIRAVIAYEDDQGFSESKTTDSIQIKKHPNNSIDNNLVKSSSSISLKNEFTKLTLVGNKNIDGNGNSLANILTGNSGNNILNGDLGNDSLYGGNGNDTLNGGRGNDRLVGGSGKDTAVFSSRNNTINIATTSRQTTGDGRDILTGIENVNGGAGNDTIRGNNAANTLRGEDDADKLYGINGADKLYGGTGNDILNGGMGNDRLIGGDGVDTAVFSSKNNRINLGSTSRQNTRDGQDILIGIENVNGGGGNDIIRGNSEANTFRGGSGVDKLYGLTGADKLYGQAGNDILYGGGDDDFLYGNNGVDKLYGQAGDDTLNGGGGVDKLYGQAGNDTLYGGTGNDTLYGGGDNDTFQINKGSGRALITDYDSDADSVELLGGLTESDLTVNYVRGDTRIRYGNDLMAIVQNTIAEDITFI